MTVEINQNFTPITAPIIEEGAKVAYLQFKDGSLYQALSFGAETHSVSGECVFQTGQILVLTFPLIGNYGTPSRELVDSLPQLPTYFESNRIHISALVVAQYSPDFSHFLASSSIADWLKENNIPPFMIRTEGSMLGKIRFPKNATSLELKLDELEDVEWVEPNARNLAAEVSLKEPKLYQPGDPTIPNRSPASSPLFKNDPNILALCDPLAVRQIFGNNSSFESSPRKQEPKNPLPAEQSVEQWGHYNHLSPEHFEGIQLPKNVDLITPRHLQRDLSVSFASPSDNNTETESIPPEFWFNGDTNIVSSLIPIIPLIGNFC